MYNIHDVNRRILAKDRRERFDYECTGYKNNYPDDNHAIYEDKKQKFIRTADDYQQMNKLALFNAKTKLEETYGQLKFEFMDHVEDNRPTDACETGLLLRKRNERKIHQDKPVYIEVCTIEPWFRRYLTLAKFIQAARTIIIKNRLLSRLEKLREINDDNIVDYEIEYKVFANVSYASLFDKFIQQ